MKLMNKIFALTIIAALMLTLAACGKDKENQNSTPNDTSKPTVSTPSEDKTTSESKPEEDNPVDNKPEDNKPDPKPEPVKKTPAQLILGKWTAKTDISAELADAGFNVDGPLEITINLEFTSSGTLIEKADKNQMSTALRTVLNQAINNALAETGKSVEEFEAEIGMSVDEYIETFVTAFQNSYTVTAEYKFAADVLLVKFEEDTTFTETNYKFVNDNTLKITTDSDETIYTRVK